MVDYFLDRLLSVSEPLDRVQQHDRQFMAKEPIRFPLPVQHPTGLAVEAGEHRLIVLEKGAAELLLNPVLEGLALVGHGGQDVLGSGGGSAHRSPLDGSRSLLISPMISTIRRSFCKIS